MKKRDRLLIMIRNDVVKNGKTTQEGVRVYVENSCIGRAAFEQARMAGYRILRRKPEPKEQTAIIFTGTTDLSPSNLKGTP